MDHIYIEPRLLGEGWGGKKGCGMGAPGSYAAAVVLPAWMGSVFSHVLALAQCEAVPGQDIPLKKPTATAGLGELFSPHSNFERHPVVSAGGSGSGNCNRRGAVKDSNGSGKGDGDGEGRAATTTTIKEKRPREDSSLHNLCLSSMCNPDGPTAARKDDASSRWQLGPCPIGLCFGSGWLRWPRGRAYVDRIKAKACSSGPGFIYAMYT